MKHPNSPTPDSRNPQRDDPIEVEPDDPNELEDDHTVFRRKRKASEFKFVPPEPSHTNGVPPTEPAHGGMQGQALQWALDALHQPAMASADWLARDIDPSQPTAVGLLTNPNITLAQVKQAKSVFKTMRIVGEKAADRRMGARMYAVAIAVALVRFGERITTQSFDALDRGFQGVVNDRRMPDQLRTIAGQAICVLRDMKNKGDAARSRSA